MSWWLRKPAEVNYAEVSEEEDLEEGLVFDSPLTSPTRPHQSPSVSPRRLLQPDPPPTPEALQVVTDKLKDLAHSSDEDSDDILASDEASEDILEGHIVVPAETTVANMPDQAVINFEDENGEDTAGALREGIQAVAKINWDDNDLKFVFKKMEISIAAAGAKKQYTKFQILSTILLTLAPPVIVNISTDLLQHSSVCPLAGAPLS